MIKHLSWVDEDQVRALEATGRSVTDIARIFHVRPYLIAKILADTTNQPKEERETA